MYIGKIWRIAFYFSIFAELLMLLRMTTVLLYILIEFESLRKKSNYLKPISIEFSSLIIGLQAFFMRNVHIWLMIARQELRPWFVNRFVNTRDFNYDLFMVVFKGKNRDYNRDVIFGL